MSTAVLGYDPGVNGGISVLDAAGRPAFVGSLNSKMTEQQALRVAWDAAVVLLQAGGWEGYCEKVGYIGKSKKNPKGDGGKGAFTFGSINGLIRGALRTKGVHLYDVPPQLWQSKLECMTGGDKNVSKRRAIELFPGVKVTHNNADSLLIALYGRMVNQ